MDTGVRYFLLQWMQQFRALQWVSAKTFLMLCVCVFAGLTVWAWRTASMERKSALQAPPFLRCAWVFALALMLLFTPHYPWYILWLVPFLTLVPNVTLLTYVLGFFYLFTTALADPGPKMFLLNKILYGGTLLAMLADGVLWRWPLHRRLHPQYGLNTRDEVKA
jgi:hypothetical protein